MFADEWAACMTDIPDQAFVLAMRKYRENSRYLPAAMDIREIYQTSPRLFRPALPAKAPKQTKGMHLIVRAALAGDKDARDFMAAEDKKDAERLVRRLSRRLNARPASPGQDNLFE